MVTPKTVMFALANTALGFIFGAGILLFSEYGQPHHRGFYCYDRDLSKPLKSGTISASMLNLIVLTVIPCCILMTEFVCFMQQRTIAWFKSCSLQAAFSIGVFLYGISIVLFATDVIKYSLGTLRPNFLTFCNPDYSKLNCTSDFGEPLFITDEEHCQTKKLDKLDSYRLSFPSGTASYSGYAAIFISLYLHFHPLFSQRYFNIPKLTFQISFCCLALYAGVTRITDYKHHPSDIVAGYVIGVVVSCTVNMNIIKGFLKDHVNTKSKDFSTDLEM